MSTYYPENTTDKQLYYVEFDRGVEKSTFTLFKRQFIMPKKQWDEMMGKSAGASDFDSSLMSNEGHPWNIMTDKYGTDGCMPDKAWVCWMVDALNEKLNSQNISL